MTGRTYGPRTQTTYYRCPYDPANPACPDHPGFVQTPERILDDFVGRFFATRVFGPGRAELLAAQLPATDADAAAQRDTQTAALNARLKRIDNAQNSKILELEELPADPSDTAAAAMRARIRARFAELHTERQQIETQLRALEKTTPAAADPTLLDQLPLPGDIFNNLPAATKIRLFKPSTCTSTGTKPANEPPSTSRSPKPPSKPSPPSSTPPKTATTTPPPIPPNPPHRPSAQHPWERYGGPSCRSGPNVRNLGEGTA
jgi:hypothetical protein